MISLITTVKKYKLLAIIILVAVSVRFVGVGSTPPSLNWDEISHGYNAYSILKTGQDEWGQAFPTIFRAYGDYKLPVYIYLTALSELLLGLTPLAVRLPSILAGIGSVIFTYLLVGELGGLGRSEKKMQTVALLSAFLMAIEPWSFFLSRGAFEANLAQFFVISGVYFFLRGLKNNASFVVSSVLFGFSVWTYNSARVFVPMLVLLLVVSSRNNPS